MRQMSRHRIRRLPVVNNRGQVIGVISQGDLARQCRNLYRVGRPTRGRRCVKRGL
jgi:CBS-domain-containing membrane protein